MSRPVVQEDGSCQFNLEQPFQKCQTGSGKVTFAPFAMESTIVTEFQLICEDSWLVRTLPCRISTIQVLINFEKWVLHLQLIG